MVVHSDRFFRARWITAACCVCLITGGLASWSGFAYGQAKQSPEGPPAIEQYRGNTRIDPHPARPSGPATLELAPSGDLEPLGQSLPTLRSGGATSPPAPGTSATPNSSSPVIPVASTQPSGTDEERRKLGELGQGILRSTSRLASECQSALDTAKESLLSSGDRLVDTLTVPARTPRVEKSTPPTVVVTQAPIDRYAHPSDELDEAGSLPWYKVVWLQLAFGAGALLLAPLIAALVLGLMIRRGGIQFRVEVVNSVPGVGLAYGITRIDPTQPDATAQPVGRIEADHDHLASIAALEAAAPPELEMTGEQFELGPTYEEERLAQLQALHQQEQALLQEIFEQNLKLRAELIEQGYEPIQRSHDDNEHDDHADEDSTDQDIIVEAIGYVTDDQDHDQNQAA